MKKKKGRLGKKGAVHDRYLSCRNWVITNAYVYACIPVPAKDRGPFIM